jgi:hypothetical protein
MGREAAADAPLAERRVRVWDLASMLLDCDPNFQVVLELGGKHHDSDGWMLSVSIDPEKKRLYIAPLRERTPAISTPASRRSRN